MKIKKFIISIFAITSFLTIVSCSEGYSGDSNNKWSIPSNKVGIDKAPKSKLEETILVNKIEFSVDNFFIDLILKNNENKSKEQLTKDLQKDLKNSNDKPFNGLTDINMNYNSFLNGDIVNKYFENKNKIFPSWLLYDVRAKFENEKLILIITIVDFSINGSSHEIKDLTDEQKAKFINQKVFEF